MLETWVILCRNAYIWVIRIRRADNSVLVTLLVYISHLLIESAISGRHREATHIPQILTMYGLSVFYINSSLCTFTLYQSSEHEILRKYQPCAVKSCILDVNIYISRRTTPCKSNLIFPLIQRHMSEQKCWLWLQRFPYSWWLPEAFQARCVQPKLWSGRLKAQQFKSIST